MRTTILIIAVLLLAGCNGVLLPMTQGNAKFDPTTGHPTEVNYTSTKAQAGFNAEVDPSTGKISVQSDNADSPRGFEDYVQAQMLIELERLKLYQSMFDQAMKAAAQGAPGP